MGVEVGSGAGAFVDSAGGGLRTGAGAGPAAGVVAPVAVVASDRSATAESTGGSGLVAADLGWTSGGGGVSLGAVATGSVWAWGSETAAASHT